MWSKGLTCTNCHGNMIEVAKPARRPWIDVPRCGTCHGPNFAENPKSRYRDSTGHGGVYCVACHGSRYAIQPTLQANDNVQSIAYQGHSGVIRECSVCHAATSVGRGPHDLSVLAIHFPPLVAK